MIWRRLQGQRNATRESVQLFEFVYLSFFLNSNRQLLSKKDLKRIFDLKKNRNPQKRNRITWVCNEAFQNHFEILLNRG